VSSAKDTAIKINPLAGKPAEPSMLVNVPKLVTAYYTKIPEPSLAEQRVAFGTSGHRGSAFDKTFNERQVLAISHAICRYRKQLGIDGPLFLGIDTHALSVLAGANALEVPERSHRESRAKTSDGIWVAIAGEAT
jgi:phosphoglucomutase